MKLNNQQVSALADKIYNKIRDGVDEYNVTVDKTHIFDDWKRNNVNIVEALSKATTYCRIYTELVDITYSYNDFLQISKVDIDDELKRVFTQRLPYKETPCNKEEIRQDIILETIENTDISVIIDKLVEKYSK